MALQDASARELLAGPVDARQVGAVLVVELRPAADRYPAEGSWEA
jgi:hypothetical protein